MSSEHGMTTGALHHGSEEDIERGTYRWFPVRGRPQRDAEGRIVRWYSLATDIDERKRAEDELEKAFEEIKRLTRGLGSKPRISGASPPYARGLRLV
jgi:PAS domain-containing protein